MAISLYDMCVPVYRQFLSALLGVLDKAEAHCKAGGAEPAQLFATRLFADMAPFPFQVSQSINHSVGALALVRGKDRARCGSLETFEAMKKEIEGAIAELDALKPSDLEGCEDKLVELKLPGREMKFSGLGYLQSFAMPQFFFHATTAYDILRHKGVPVGKRDYLGQIRLAG